MAADHETIRCLLSDGGIRSVQLVNGSLMIALPKEAATRKGVDKGANLPIIPSDEEGVLFEVLAPGSE